ncbi:uncharacterized protein LOC143033019 isoform X2 [Oratosquilla oratoria]|uniref:uncharacterized protein LOC143033019 isoform X2 n=1 Tax=Oratosquilla oratoria TaxID=337810 RepID=UPI003F760D12
MIMENLVFLLLVLLATCQSLQDCPEDDIERGKTTRDFPLTGNETIIHFSQKNNNNKFGEINFIMKCPEQQEIVMKIVQKGPKLSSIQLNAEDVIFKEFHTTNPTKMRLTHSEKILTSSIMDTKEEWRELLRNTPLLPQQGSCTLHAESNNQYAVWFTCPNSADARANIWYLLMLPVFVMVFALLYLMVTTLLKLYRESGVSPADTFHMDEKTS